MIPLGDKDYSDGRTKQAFKDSTDINKIIKKGQVTDGIAHALKYSEAAYGEFTGVDLLGHFEQIDRARVIFADLPAEVRREFDQDAFKFAGYASAPENIGRLKELIPSIAEPESFFAKAGDLPPAAAVVPAVPVVAEVVPPVVAAPIVPAGAPEAPVASSATRSELAN